MPFPGPEDQGQNFLFATLDAGGNLPPAVGIARELVRLGHRVRFLGHPQQAAAIRATGAKFQPYSHSPRMTMAEQMPTLRQVSMLVSVFSDAGIARDVVEEVRREPPDVAIVDCLLLGAIDAAAKSGLFTVALVHSFCAFFDGPFRRTPITAALALRGLGPRRVMDQAHRILVCADHLLDPADGLPLGRFDAACPDQPEHHGFQRTAGVSAEGSERCGRIFPWRPS